MHFKQTCYLLLFFLVILPWFSMQLINCTIQPIVDSSCNMPQFTNQYSGVHLQIKFVILSFHAEICCHFNPILKKLLSIPKRIWSVCVSTLNCLCQSFLQHNVTYAALGTYVGIL